ncbi:MAG TPA: L-threonylcarbamoyladenylate synthase [Lentimicrobium sp.]|jgi:L-threonylcarbamoyladenylate synthase|nr:L-threonylcarbamoyladenylate synthase [Lentimicrobium sp.]
MDEIIAEEIRKTVNVLRNGGVILYPTDTVWGLGCDALNAKAVDKVYKIKKRHESKSLIILLSSFESLEQYVQKVPEITEDLISSIERPVTVIYDNARNLPKNVTASDGTIAIRIVRDAFCKNLIEALGHPLISSSANISGEPTPLVFSRISQDIIDSVDYCVQLYHDQFVQAKASSIIRLYTNGEYKVIRD